jgi:hypothetical protein
MVNIAKYRDKIVIGGFILAIILAINPMEWTDVFGTVSTGLGAAIAAAAGLITFIKFYSGRQTLPSGYNRNPAPYVSRPPMSSQQHRSFPQSKVSDRGDVIEGVHFPKKMPGHREYIDPEVRVSAEDRPVDFRIKPEVWEGLDMTEEEVYGKKKKGGARK